MDTQPVFSRLAAHVLHAFDFESGVILEYREGRLVPKASLPGKETLAVEGSRLLPIFETKNGTFHSPAREAIPEKESGYVAACTVFFKGELIGAVALFRESPFEDEDEMSLNASVALTVLEVERFRFFKMPSEKGPFDETTDFFNNRVFQRALTARFTEWKRYGNSFSLILISVDGFRELREKQAEEEIGKVLKCVSREMKEVTRKSDLTFKVGAAEFILILPATPLSDARQFGSRLKERVENRAVTTDMGEQISVTLSMGVVEATAEIDTAKTLISRLDSALFASRQRGGGCITIFDHLDEELKTGSEPTVSP